jgi:hypothetical protein
MIIYKAIRTNHFPWKMAVPSQECDSSFSVVPVVEMVELLIGFVGFCGLSHLNAPCTTVPLLLPLWYV